MSNATAKSRPAVSLVSSPLTCKRMLEDKAKHHEGWSNTATWTFALYFGQERRNYEAICDLLKRAMRRARGGALHESVYARAHDLMGRVYRRGYMEPMDGDEEGSVNVREIVDYYAAELGLTSKPKKGKKS